MSTKSKRAPSQVGRRAFLRGVGAASAVSMGLPVLDAFTPRRAQAQPAELPRCAVFVRQGNGVAQVEVLVRRTYPHERASGDNHWHSKKAARFQASHRRKFRITVRAP